MDEFITLFPIFLYKHLILSGNLYYNIPCI